MASNDKLPTYSFGEVTSTNSGFRLIFSLVVVVVSLGTGFTPFFGGSWAGPLKNATICCQKVAFLGGGATEVVAPRLGRLRRPR